MKPTFHILGTAPEHYQQALRALEEDLGVRFADTGIDVTCIPGQELAVECDGTAVTVTWGTPIQFYRAISLIPIPLVPCSIHEKARFQSSGIMFDCSRNAVLNPTALRFFLRKMALMGLNLGMMYTEDTYEVPGQPFFGYKRGRYTYDELKALDDYANLFGIELCPCIQTLGHLKRILHWPAYHHLRDNDEVLLADLEETYVLLEQMIQAATAPYRSKKIHLGMDEAFGVGLGAHLTRFGYEDPHSVIGRHLSRVLGICDKYGLEAMMWSDMYFHLDGRNYHSPGLPSESAKAAVDPRITLMYWDYYQSREEKYADALYKHAQFPAPTVFAGGIWTWIGPAPDYPTTIANTVAGLTACAKAGIPLALATAWGDNGGECNLTAALLGLQLYGELTFRSEYDPQLLAERFRRCCHADAQAFLDLSLLNYMPGMKDNPSDPVNACKFMLYQDPLVQLFEADTQGYAMARHFGSLVTRYARYAVPAGQHCRRGNCPGGGHGVAPGIPGDFRPQSPEALGGGFDIPVGIRAAQVGFLPGKGGANQQPVGLGFGGDGRYRPREPGWLDGNVHTHKPDPTKSVSCSTGMGRISQRPMARGTIRFTRSPARFLSESICRVSASAG